MVSRRKFLQTASGLAVAIAAPLYIPAERLDFGVPTKLYAPKPFSYFVTGDMGIQAGLQVTWKNMFLSADEINTIMPISEMLFDAVGGRTWREHAPFDPSKSGTLLDRQVFAATTASAKAGDFTTTYTWRAD